MFTQKSLRISHLTQNKINGSPMVHATYDIIYYQSPPGLLTSSHTDILAIPQTP